jgi:two-component system, LytTR family, sensor kinase
MSLHDWPRVVAAALVLAWSWALLTPGIFRLTRTIAPTRVGWLASVVGHATVVAVLTLSMTALRLWLVRVLIGAQPGPFLQMVIFWVDVNLFTYLAVVLTGSALQSHRRYVDRALRAHVLEAQLARAQLHFLELQLQPHFLFNSLNAIQELAHEAPDAAEQMLRRLHVLLALSLERSGRDEVSLRDELAALEPYLDIQRARFDWLAVTVQTDADSRGALVPHLILQPLIENAIRHGLAVRRGPGRIGIKAGRHGGRLRLEVRDDGVGLPRDTARLTSGIGLRNAGERLRQLYGSEHRFVLRNAPEGGVLVEIDVPFRPAPASVTPASWDALGRSRETIPEVAVDEVASWRTGEFVASIAARDDRLSSLAAFPLIESAGARVPLDGVGSPGEQPGGDRRADYAAGAGAHPADSGRDDAAGDEVRVDGASIVSVRTWFALVGLWLGAAALWIAQLHIYWWLEAPTVARFDLNIVKLEIAGAMYWMAVSVGVLYLARRFRLTGRRPVVHLAIHLTAAVGSSFAFLMVLGALHLSTAPILNPFNINPLSGNFFVYFGLLAWSHSRDFVAWYRARELAAAELTSEIARSRFQALCVQVRPQFLLGTLDLLARLVHVDVPRADRLIARLADVLRLTLDMARESMTTLQEELQLLAVTVEAHHLGVRPAVTLETTIDTAALTTAMPSRLLCTMADDLLAAEPEGAAVPLVVRVRAERTADATRVRLQGDAAWRTDSAGLHTWWKTKSAAEAAVAGAGPLVTVALPDRATAVLIIADPLSATAAEPAAA